MTLKGKYQRPLPSDGSEKSFFPCYAVNLNQCSQIPALTLVILSRPASFGGGMGDLAPTSHSGLVREGPASTPVHTPCSQGSLVGNAPSAA